MKKPLLISVTNLLVGSLVFHFSCLGSKMAFAGNGEVRVEKALRIPRRIMPANPAGARLSQPLAGDREALSPEAPLTTGAGLGSQAVERLAPVSPVDDAFLRAASGPDAPSDTSATPPALPGKQTPANGHIVQSGALVDLIRAPGARADSDFPAGYFDQSAGLRREAVTATGGQVEESLAKQSRELRSWAQAPQRTLVIAQSLSFPKTVIRGVHGMEKYDARALALILEARDPNLRVLFVTSERVPRYAVYHLLGNMPDRDGILSRVKFVVCEKSQVSAIAVPLASRLLQSEKTLEAIRQQVGEWGYPAALVPFVTGKNEWAVAEKLGMPLYSSHPALAEWGTKSGSRRTFKEAGLAPAPGFENVHSLEDIVNAIDGLWTANHGLRRVILKTDDGVSGLRNVKLRLPLRWVVDAGAERKAVLTALVHKHIDSMRLLDEMTGEEFLREMNAKGGVVEAYVENKKSTPSGQAEILPDGTVTVLSTHEQVLDKHGVFTGAKYPAHNAYREEIEAMTSAIGEKLAEKGVVGRFAVDYIAVSGAGGNRRLIPVEINVRTGGATHPYFTALYLTEAQFRNGVLVRPDGKPVVYNAMDHALYPGLKGANMTAFLRFFGGKNVLFDRRSGTGVVFHLLNAVPLEGNVGYTVIGTSRKEVDEIERRLRGLLGELEAARKNSLQ